MVREDGFGGGVVMLVNLGEPGRAALGIEGAGGPVFSVWRLSSANACVLLLCEGRPFLKSRIIGSILLATPTRANLIENLERKRTHLEKLPSRSSGRSISAIQNTASSGFTTPTIGTNLTKVSLNRFIKFCLCSDFSNSGLLEMRYV